MNMNDMNDKYYLVDYKNVVEPKKNPKEKYTEK